MKSSDSAEGYRDTGSLVVPPDTGKVGEPDADGRVLIVVERGTFIWSEPMDDGGRAVVKMYRHRSWIEPWRRGHLLRYRTQREYAALSHLVKHKIPCSVPLYWSYGYRPDQGHYEILATREIPDAMTVLSQFAEPDNEGGGLDLAPLFRHVRAMHESSVFHGALLLRNMLVTFGEDRQSSFYIIDMARTNLFPHGIVGTRMAWYDLLELTEQIQRYKGGDYCTALLLTYGLDEASAAKLVAHASRYRPSRETRNILRGEFGFRCALAKAMSRLRPKKTDPEQDTGS